jgi:hypothetical protein
MGPASVMSGAKAHRRRGQAGPLDQSGGDFSVNRRKKRKRSAPNEKPMSEYWSTKRQSY